MSAGRAPIAALLATFAAILAGVLGLSWWATLPGADPTGIEVAARAGGPAAEPRRLSTRIAEPADELAASTVEGAGRAPIVGAAGAATPAPATAPAAQRARPCGVLVDESTHAPLPEYRLRLTDRSGVQVTVVTDSTGQFAADRALACGPLNVEYTEGDGHASHRRQVVLAAEPDHGSSGYSAPLELVVAAGPTYRVTLSPPGAVRPQELGATLHWTREGGGEVSSSAAVRDGEPPWIRFKPLRGARGQAATLSLGTSYARWSGRVEVPLESAAVHVPLEAFAALEVHVGSGDGQSVGNAVATLIAPGGDGTEDRRSSPVQGSGQVRFHFLRAGPATLRVKAWRYHDAEVPVFLEPAVCTKLGVTLVRERDAGAIRGVVVSDSGRYRQDVSVRLSRPDARDAPEPLACRVAWMDGAGTVSGAFAFERLPPGPWQLSILERDWFEWEPRQLEVAAPLAGLELRVHDAVAVADLVVRTRSADGRSPVGPFDLLLASGATRETFRSEQPHRIVTAWPVDQPLSWRIDAPGYVPATGTLASFAPTAAVDGRERRTCEVVLEPGWGELVQVVRAVDGAPIQDAAVLLDGREAARTDAQGRALVRAPSAPERIVASWRDWITPARSAGDLTRAREQGLEARIEMRAPRVKRP